MMMMIRRRSVVVVVVVVVVVRIRRIPQSESLPSVSGCVVHQIHGGPSRDVVVVHVVYVAKHHPRFKSEEDLRAM